MLEVIVEVGRVSSACMDWQIVSYPCKQARRPSEQSDIQTGRLHADAKWDKRPAESQHCFSCTGIIRLKNLRFILNS